MSFIVCAYYTRNTFYADEAVKLKKSLVKYHIPYHIQDIENTGSWHKNTSYKPTFIKKMMESFPIYDIVYVDVDAEFLAYPSLFDELDCLVAVHKYDRSLYFKNRTGTEILSGTIFFKNHKSMHRFVSRWENRCQNRPQIWDQKHLEAELPSIDNAYYELPATYCKIFDTMRRVKNAVIVQYQASRKVRENKRILSLDQGELGGSFPKGVQAHNATGSP